MESQEKGTERMPEKLMAYVITAENGSISGMAGIIQKMGRELGWSEKCIYQLNLALDEIISNTLAYGYAQPGAQRIEVFLEQEGNMLKMTIMDNAAPFNPLQGAEPELEKPPLQRERCVGGMGIHLMKSMMDRVLYRYDEGKNILEMEKNLEVVTPCASPPVAGIGQINAVRGIGDAAGSGDN